MDKKQVEKEISEILKRPNDSYSYRQVEFLPEKCKIIVREMYGYAKIKFEHLEAISKLLGTEKINISSEECERSGCESCDYGSVYAVILTFQM